MYAIQDRKRLSNLRHVGASTLYMASGGRARLRLPKDYIGADELCIGLEDEVGWEGRGSLEVCQIRIVYFRPIAPS